MSLLTVISNHPPFSRTPAIPRVQCDHGPEVPCAFLAVPIFVQLLMGPKFSLVLKHISYRQAHLEIKFHLETRVSTISLSIQNEMA